MVDKVEHGEFRNELALDMQQSLGRMINHFYKEESYWVLVYTDVAGNEIQTKIMRLSQCPPKMLGTMCYYVDNKKCKLKRLWVLPLDIPREPGVIDLETGLKEVLKSAKGELIVY